MNSIEKIKKFKTDYDCKLTDVFFMNFIFLFFSRNNDSNFIFKKNASSFQIDVTRELEILYNKIPAASAKKPPRTFKLKRAQMNHLQTLREISQQRQAKEEDSDNEKGETSSLSASKTHTE